MQQNPEEPDNLQVPTFTCNTCQITYNNGQLFKDHYSTGWHRFNSNRVAAHLPMISEAQFKRREEINEKKMEAANKPVNINIYCTACGKRFSKQNAYDNHVKSKKHQEKEKEEKERIRIQGEAQRPKKEIIEDSSDEDDDIESVDSDEWNDDNPIDNNDCLFCSHHSRNFLKNLNHMTAIHSFFIPDIEYCIDIKGLMRFLGEKVNTSFMCLWCNEKGRTFHSSEAARNHMLSKGHCRMFYEGIACAEYMHFYDYSTSYPDANDENVNADEEIEVPNIVENDDLQLVLPSGVVIGHRSLMRYYRQSTNRKTTVTVRNDKKLHKVLAFYRSLGWSGTDLASAAKAAKDIHYMKRLQSKFNMKLGVKANKLQKHFRIQNNF